MSVDAGRGVQGPFSYIQTLYWMALILIFQAFGFGILYSSFTLFLMHGFDYTVEAATSLYILYASWFFTLSIIGGFLGGRLGHREAIWIGSFLLCLSYLGFGFQHWLYWSCALMCVGTGFFLPNAMVIIGHAKRDEHHRPLNPGYILLYLSVNIGVLLGGMAATYTDMDFYSRLFLVAAFFVLFAGGLFTWGYPKIQFLPDSHSAFQIRQGKVFLKILALLVLGGGIAWAVQILLHHETWSNCLVIAFGVISILALLGLGFLPALGLTAKERRSVRWFTVLILSTLVFWALYNLEQSLVVTFFDLGVDHSIGDYLIPASFLGTFNALVDIVFGFFLMTVLKDRMEKISSEHKIFSAIILMGLAYWLMALGAKWTPIGHYVPMEWTFIAFVMMGVSEIIIAPLSNSIAIEYGPPPLQSFFVGFCQLASGVAGSAANYLNQWGVFTQKESLSSIIGHTMNAYLLYGFLGVGVGGLLLLIYSVWLRFNKFNPNPSQS